MLPESTATKIKFNLIPKNEGFGNNKQQVSTRVLDIKCEKDHAPLLKLAFLKAKIDEQLPTGKFIPQGYIQMVI